MSKAMRAVLVSAGTLVALVAVCGFFYSPGGVLAHEKTICPQPDTSPAEYTRTTDASCGKVQAHTAYSGEAKDGRGRVDAMAERGAWNLPNSGNYRRAAEFQLKVKDSIKTDEDLEGRATKVGGTLLDLVLEGTEGARSGAIAFKIPSDKVNEFIRDVRHLGKVQHERITAQQIAATGNHGAGDSDEREFSLVSIRFADEAVAPEVQRSRGLFAASFDRSASHFLNGLSVLVELAGLVLPYAFALGFVVAPIGLILRLRRRARIVKIEEAQA